jgi:hypothetical protein
MTTKRIVGVLAVGVALFMLAGAAEARCRSWRHRHHRSFGVRVYSDVYPSRDWSLRSGYAPYDCGDYGADCYSDYSYNSYEPWYDDGPYPSRYRTYRRYYSAPSFSFHLGGHRDYDRGHRDYDHGHRHHGRR